MNGTLFSSTHPPIPHSLEDDPFDCLRLLRSRRVGPATYRRLLNEHGSALGALEALPEIAAAAGVTGYEICPKGVVAAEMKAARAKGARLLLTGQPDFPEMLYDLMDAPAALWAIGNIALLQTPMIALVGARNASSLGTRMAKRLATDLKADGYTIVSGLARGIDASAHVGATASGTVAVLAGGVDVVYPRENQSLYADICGAGLCLSEMPMGTGPQARHFPARNRIVAGLSRAVVVIEAAAKSGSLITARNALDQGRDVLAVPGHPFDARSAGCNILLREGATLVRHAGDVTAALAPISGPDAPIKTVPSAISTAPRPPVNLRKVADLHSRILDRLGPSPLAEDQLIRDLKMPAAEAAPALVTLELEGEITRQPGGLLSRTASGN